MKINPFKYLWRDLRNHPYTVAIVDWTRRNTVPGFKRVTIYEVLSFMRVEIPKSDMATRANAMAYSFLLSLFPFAMVLLTLLPYLPLGNYVDLIEINIKQINAEIKLLPHDTEVQILETFREFTLRPKKGLLSFGFLLAIFFASNGVMGLMRGFDKEFTFLQNNDSDFRKRLTAIKITFLLGTLFLFSIILIMVGDYLINILVEYINADFITKISFKLIRWVVILFLFYTSFSIIYRDVAKLRHNFKFFNPGATTATILSILSSAIFSYMVNRYEMYNNVYGSIGTLIGFMLWLQINSNILILGFELNVAILYLRNQHTQRGVNKDAYK